MLHARMLTYLDEVARSGSIRKAAGKLHVASTAINRPANPSSPKVFICAHLFKVFKIERKTKSA